MKLCKINYCDGCDSIVQKGEPTTDWHSDLKRAMGKDNVNATKLHDTDLNNLDGKHTGGSVEIAVGKGFRIKLVDPLRLSYLKSSKPKEEIDVVVGLEGDWGPMDEQNLKARVLWVCNLNPVTEDEDVYTIFSRFGTVASAEIIRDGETGDSHCYGFIEYEDKEACELAYFNMVNAVIDDRKIHVGFSQSAAKSWNQC